MTILVEAESGDVPQPSAMRTDQNPLILEETAVEFVEPPRHGLTDEPLSIDEAPNIQLCDELRTRIRVRSLFVSDIELTSRMRKSEADKTGMHELNILRILVVFGTAIGITVSCVAGASYGLYAWRNGQPFLGFNGQFVLLITTGFVTFIFEAVLGTIWLWLTWRHQPRR